jgi:hypothetical protein
VPGSMAAVRSSSSREGLSPLSLEAKDEGQPSRVLTKPVSRGAKTRTATGQLVAVSRASLMATDSQRSFGRHWIRRPHRRMRRRSRGSW